MTTNENTLDMMDPLESEVARMEADLATATDPEMKADLEGRIARFRAQIDLRRATDLDDGPEAA